MRILTTFLAFISFIPLNGQELKDTKVIQLNTKFILELTANGSSNMTYKIVSTEPFNDEIKVSSAFQLLDKDLEINQVQGILTSGTFGSQRSILLVMKNGLEKPLQYELMIDINGKGKFKKTSTYPLNPGILSTEIWPYNIHSIKITLFQEKELEPIIIPDTKIDSVCILNPELIVKNGELLLMRHLDKVNKGFIRPEFLKLESMLSFEDSVNSTDVSLGHFYSLGNGIYPFFKNHEFGNPLRYRRLECPYFDGYSSYFYTEKEKTLKVVGYQWGELKLNGWPAEEIDRTELRNAFEKKYESIKIIVTETLGKPRPLIRKSRSGRINTKWKSDDGINAYLFMFRNYNEISLYVYRD